MSDFLSMFSAYYMYVFTGISIVVVIISFVICNTEEFPYSDSCFDCNNKSCQRCSSLNSQELVTYQRKLKPIACQPVGCLQYIKAIAPEDTENLANL